MNDDRLNELLRAALPAAASEGPSRDLWPLVSSRVEAPTEWSWFDLTLVALIATALLLFPEGVFILAYHL